MATADATRAHLEPVVVPSSSFLSSTKVLNPKGCSMEVDKALDDVALVMRGDVSSTRVQLPAEDRPLSSLRLRYSLATLQVRLSSADHFALEVTVGQSVLQRTKIIIGTHIKEPRQDLSLNGVATARLPLVIPRNRWVQVIFHIAGIVSYIFGMTPMQSIDAVALCGTARVGMLKVSNSEKACIDSAPEGFSLFAVPAYSPPVWSSAVSIPAESKGKDGSTTAARQTSPLPQKDDGRAPKSLLSSPRNQPSGLPANNLASGCHGRALPLAGSPKTAPLARGASVPARLEPIAVGDGLVAKKELSAGGNAAGANDANNAGTPSPPPASTSRGHPVSLPTSSHGATGGGLSPLQKPQLQTSSSSPPSLKPSQAQPSARGYVRLISSASPRPGSSSKTLAMYGRQRSCPGSEHQRSEPQINPDASSWWDDVGCWESVDGGAAAGAPMGTAGAAANRPGAPRDKADNAKGGARSAVVPPTKPKGKMTPEAERMQRLVASRKRKVGLVGSRAAPPGGGAADENGAGALSAGAGGHEGDTTKGTRRRRTRRRQQIIRANEKQANRLAMAKMLVPSEIPIKPSPLVGDTSVEGASPGATGDDAAGSGGIAAEPKYGYGFGYMGVLHEDGEYEEDEGAGLKGGWSLAISEDDDVE